MCARTPDLEALRTIGWTLWDPIGLAGERSHTPPAADIDDEYDRYVLTGFDMALNGHPAKQIAEYLGWVRRDHMGLGGLGTATDSELRTAQAIHDLAYRAHPKGG